MYAEIRFSVSVGVKNGCLMILFMVYLLYYMRGGSVI